MFIKGVQIKTKYDKIFKYKGYDNDSHILLFIKFSKIENKII